MQPSLRFLLGVLATGDPPGVHCDDLEGEHASVLRHFQGLGVLHREPEWDPRTGCPHCQEGEPVLLQGQWRCRRCLSLVHRDAFLLWRLNLAPLLGWLARAANLQGGVQQIDLQLWQLGSLTDGSGAMECFFLRSGGPPSAQGRRRLSAYRRALLFSPLPEQAGIVDFDGPRLSLLETLHFDGATLSVGPLSPLLHGRGHVRFDEASGALWIGERLLGEVSLGSKEHALLACLWENVNLYVPYRTLKRGVLDRTGSMDTTEEATFCQRLKSRLKKAIPEIDRVIMTTNKSDGYRLRSTVEA